MPVKVELVPIHPEMWSKPRASTSKLDVVDITACLVGVAVDMYDFTILVYVDHLVSL